MHPSLSEGVDLCRAQAPLSETVISVAVDALFDEVVAEADKKCFLEALITKGETPREIKIFADLLLKKAAPFPVSSRYKNRPIFDSCGTGGGGLNLFNVSTAIVPILASLGVPVVKHGNRGITKKSGSADVLEALGIPLQLTPEQAFQCLEEVGCTFLWAPQFHPHFKIIANVRKQLGAEGKRTIFNLLGPLLNPARPQSQLLGVFDRDHMTLFHDVLKTAGISHAVVLGRAPDGTPLGEASPWGRQDYLTTPLDMKEILSPLHFPQTESTESLQSLLIANAEESSRRILAVLYGDDRGLARDMVVVNATVGLLIAEGAALFSEARQIVEEAIDSKKALQKLEIWQKWRPR